MPPRHPDAHVQEDFFKELMTVRRVVSGHPVGIDIVELLLVGAERTYAGKSWVRTESLVTRWFWSWWKDHDGVKRMDRRYRFAVRT